MVRRRGGHKAKAAMRSAPLAEDIETGDSLIDQKNEFIQSE
jgi:hypothetical protein